MKLEIFYEKSTYKKFFESKKLEKVFHEKLKNTKKVLIKKRGELVVLAEQKTLCVNIVTDASIKKLNKEFRCKNMPTDVLSWGFISENLMKDEAFGEIYISFETAKKQAGDKQHSLEHELVFLYIHGLLHVFEYDHRTDEEEKEMNAIAEEIME